MAGTDRRILLGHITGVHGVRGDVIVKSYTELPADIAAYGALQDDAGARTFELKVVRVGKKGVIVRIKGIDDRNVAEDLKGTGLYALRDQMPEPADDEFLHADLIGLRAIDVNGAAIGEVVAVQNFGAGDLLEIRLSGANKTELIPFNMTFVPAIDVAAKRIVVAMPAEDGDQGEA